MDSLIGCMGQLRWIIAVVVLLVFILPLYAFVLVHLLTCAYWSSKMRIVSQYLKHFWKNEGKVENEKEQC